MVMDQLVMTGLFPVGSEEKRGEEKRRGEKNGTREAKGGVVYGTGSSKGYFFSLHQTA